MRNCAPSLKKTQLHTLVLIINQLFENHCSFLAHFCAKIALFLPLRSDNPDFSLHAICLTLKMVCICAEPGQKILCPYGMSQFIPQKLPTVPHCLDQNLRNYRIFRMSKFAPLNVPIHTPKLPTVPHCLDQNLQNYWIFRMSQFVPLNVPLHTPKLPNCLNL